MLYLVSLYLAAPLADPLAMFGSLARPASPPTVTGLVPDDGGHSIQLPISDITTHSVRLSPSRAYVVRGIDNLALEPGTNHITLIGLSPTVDEHSIKLEATGPVAITDFSVHLLPNRAIYEDLYPDSDDHDTTDSGSDDESGETQAAEPGENESVMALRAELDKLHDEKQQNLELVASAEFRLNILDGFGRRIVAPQQTVVKDNMQQPLPAQPQLDIAASLETYKTERDKAFRDNLSGKSKALSLSLQVDKLTKQLDREVNTAAKARLKANKAQLKAAAAKEKSRQRRLRQAEEKSKEKLRVRREREACWPRNVHVVRVTLEMGVPTPGSNRRESFSSDIVYNNDSENQDGRQSTPMGPCGLILSYMTTSAYWRPTYDMSLSTVADSAILCFDALLTNHTSETWNNCKVSLTTSETELADFADQLPRLHAWQVKIADKDNTTLPERVSDNILHSAEELQNRSNFFFNQNSRSVVQTRSVMFGYSPEQNHGPLHVAKSAFASQGFGVSSNTATSAFGSRPQHSAGGLFGGSTAKGALFGSTQNAQPAGSVSAGSLFGSAQPAATNNQPQASSLFGQAIAVSADDDAASGQRASSNDVTTTNNKPSTHALISGAMPNVDSQVPSMFVDQDAFTFEQLGLTSNYELPNRKTLKPSAPTHNGVGGSSRQRVARITNFTEVAFSRTVIAKLKAATYLRVKLRNSSRIPIISGMASITLDGNFLGRMQVPQASRKTLFGSTLECVKPGEHMTLDLGRDPSIEVKYLGPSAKTISGGYGAAAAGFLLGSNKDISRVYTRHIVLSNRREHGSDAAVDVQRPGKKDKSEEGEQSAEAAPKPLVVKVLDQIPITEDERLRVEILQPRGLTSEGQEVDIEADGMPRFTTGSGFSKKLDMKDNVDDHKNNSWGQAQARLLKEGKVEWDVTLNPSRTVKLTLEYQCSYPKGESVVGVYQG